VRRRLRATATVLEWKRNRPVVFYAPVLEVLLTKFSMVKKFLFSPITIIKDRGRTIEEVCASSSCRYLSLKCGDSDTLGKTHCVTVLLGAFYYSSRLFNTKLDNQLNSSFEMHEVWKLAQATTTVLEVVKKHCNESSLKMP